MLTELAVPVIVAPMAGGITTPELVAAVVNAGGFGFLAGGFLGAGPLGELVERTRELTEDPFGVNLFVPGTPSEAELTGYQRRVAVEATRHGVQPGEPRWDDDAYSAKLDVVVEQRIPVVSFTFGVPDATAVARLHDVGAQVVVTVTTPAEARQAAGVGADALCVQGCDAGGHRGTFADDGSPGGGELYGVLAALRLVAAAVDLPLVATGGLVDGADVAAVLAGGAVAAQLGTAFLGCPEAATPAPYREALRDEGTGTMLTRAFTGRPARGLVNRFAVEHGSHAPAAYPQVHYLTRPVRTAAGRIGDADSMSLWAGQTYALARPAPAAEIVRRLAVEARAALARASARFPASG